MLEVRSWLAMRVGCDPDELRFAGADARRADDVVLHFTLKEQPGYRVEITLLGTPGQRREWVVAGEWPAGVASVTVDQKPSW